MCVCQFEYMSCVCCVHAQRGQKMVLDTLSWNCWQLWDKVLNHQAISPACSVILNSMLDK